MWPKSLYRSRAGRHFYGTENVIWAGIGPIGNTEKKKFGPIMSNFWERFFHVFRCKNFFNFFLHPKTWKNHPQKLLMIGPNFFFQYCQSAQHQTKLHLVFHKNVSLCDFYIMTLAESLRRTLKEARVFSLCFSIDSATKTDTFFVTCLSHFSNWL